MISIRFEQSSISETNKSLDRMSARFKNAINRAIAESVINIERNAKIAAPVNVGQLRAAIAKQLSPERMEGRVVSQMNYSSAVEFGRRPGTFPNISDVNGLRWWVRRKGLARTPKRINQLAYIIGRSIQKKGIKPKPYLEPAYRNELPNFQENLRRYLREAQK